MKRKIIFATCTVFIFVALIGMIIFAFSGEFNEETKTVDLVGTWEIVASVNGNIGTLTDQQFMIFDSETAFAYKEDTSTPYAASVYKIVLNDMFRLELPDVSRTYVIDVKSDNHIRLYEDPNSYISLIRYPQDDLTPVAMEQSILVGQWQVVYRDTDEMIDETLEFNQSEFYDYRNGASEPYATSSYSWISDTCFASTQLGLTMDVHPISNDLIILVQNDTCNVWELQRID